MPNISSANGSSFRDTSRRQYVAIRNFNLNAFQYVVTTTDGVTSGVVSLFPGLTASKCPAGRILRETGRKIVPEVNPGVDRLLVSVYDDQTFLKYYIDPNSPLFAVYTTDKVNFLDNPPETNSRDPGPNGLTDAGPPVYTNGSVIVNATTNDEYVSEISINDVVSYGGLYANSSTQADNGLPDVSGDIVFKTGSKTNPDLYADIYCKGEDNYGEIALHANTDRKGAIYVKDELSGNIAIRTGVTGEGWDDNNYAEMYYNADNLYNSHITLKNPSSHGQIYIKTDNVTTIIDAVDDVGSSYTRMDSSGQIVATGSVTANHYNLSNVYGTPAAPIAAAASFNAGSASMGTVTLNGSGSPSGKYTVSTTACRVGSFVFLTFNNQTGMSYAIGGGGGTVYTVGMSAESIGNGSFQISVVPSNGNPIISWMVMN